MSEEPKVYGYRWVILILAFLVHCGLQVALIITCLLYTSRCV